jgi:hypothetical protein
MHPQDFHKPKALHWQQKSRHTYYRKKWLGQGPCMAIDPLHGQCLTPAIGNNLPCNPLGFGKQVVPVHTSFQDGKGMPHTNPTDKYWTSAQAGSRAQNLQK